MRSLVGLHGGTVTAHSEGPGTGSTFTIRIPCLPASSAAVPSRGPDAAGADAAGGGLKVLVVDDNVDAAETLASLLEITGSRTRMVHMPDDVLPAAVEFRPDVVLLDIGLPGRTGYDVARELRADARFAHTLLVAVTGWGAEADRLRARDAGFDHHLTKPVNIQDLLPLLRRAPQAA